MSSSDLEDKRVIAAAAFISALVVLYWQFMPVVIGSVAEARGYSESALGFLASAYAGGLFLTTLTGVFWVRRYNWKKLIAVGSLISAAAYLLPIFYQSYEVLLASHLLASMGGGVGYGVTLSLLGDTKDPARNYAISFLAQVLLGIVATLWLSNIESSVLALNSGFVLMSVSMLLCIYLARFIPAKGVKTGHARDLANGVVRPRAFAIPCLLLAVLFVFTGDGAVWAFLERIGAAAGSRSLGGTLVSASLVGGVLGSLTGGILGIRWGYVMPMAFAIALSILSVVMFAMFKQHWLLILAALINGFGWNFGIAYRMGLVAELDVTGRFTVLVPAMQTLGNTIGPASAGLLIESGGFNYAYYFASAGWLIALALYLVSHKEYVLTKRRGAGKAA